MEMRTTTTPSSPLFQEELVKQIKIGGIYRHYKGMEYRIITVARSSSDLHWLVVYQTCYENPVAQIWTRELEEFLSSIINDGKEQPRFTLITKS